MAKGTSNKSAQPAKKAATKRVAAKADTPRSRSVNQQPAPAIRFSATLLRPATTANADSNDKPWTFLTLPTQASRKLPSRGMVSVEGTLNGSPFRATLEPDGQGGHWMKIDQKLRDTAGARSLQAGDSVTLEIAPIAPADEPEPEVPPDFKKALAAAPKKAREVWSDITPVARRDWIQWITSGKRAETRALRIDKACDMLAKGKRRPCCFDRSGMYGKSLSCPTPE